MESKTLLGATGFEHLPHWFVSSPPRPRYSSLAGAPPVLSRLSPVRDDRTPFRRPSFLSSLAGLRPFCRWFPPMNRWAILGRPSRDFGLTSPSTAPACSAVGGQRSEISVGPPAGLFMGNRYADWPVDRHVSGGILSERSAGLRARRVGNDPP